jgi:hypothetical protein
MVVEITPPGIRTLHWRFYIIWCVFNFTFIPIGKAGAAGGAVSISSTPRPPAAR